MFVQAERAILHESPVRAMGEQGAVEGVVDFGELVQAPHSGRKAGHMLDHAREPGESTWFISGRAAATRAFKDAADFVFVLYFLTGHLADVLTLLWFRRDQAVLREDLQRLADWCAADAEAFGKGDFLNLLAGASSPSSMQRLMNSTTWPLYVWRLNVCMTSPSKGT